MKATLFATFVALLMVGCGESDLDDPETRKIIAEAIDGEKLEWRGAQAYGTLSVYFQQTPYTGWVKRMDTNGQIEMLSQFKDGKRDGLSTYWRTKLAWWDSGGQKLSECTYKDGKRDGLEARWYKNGEKNVESTWKDDKLVTAVVWKPNGERCPETGVDENGNAVWVHYNDDGAEDGRDFYRDGKFVSWMQIERWDNGQKKSETTLKDEKRDGLWAYWHENGQKQREETYKDGKLWTAVAWKPNGEKCPVTNVVDGNGVVVEYDVDGNGVSVAYNEDGTERSFTYKDGEIVKD